MAIAGAVADEHRLISNIAFNIVLIMLFVTLFC